MSSNPVLTLVFSTRNVPAFEIEVTLHEPIEIEDEYQAGEAIAKALFPSAQYLYAILKATR